MKILHKFIIAYVFLTILDIITTTVALQGMIATEYNPFMKLFVNNLFMFISVKAIGVFLIVWIMAWCVKRNQKTAKSGMYIIIFMSILIVLNNTYWILF